MLPTRTFKPNPTQVTVQKIDGQSRTGRMTAFSPHEADQVIEIASTKGPGTTALLPSEQIAFVAFHRPPGDPPPAASEASTPTRIRIVGGGEIMVDAPQAGLRHPLGFYATPGDSNSPYSEIFFYAHGVASKERVEPIGEMLLRNGMLDATDLGRGLAEQAAGRSVPVGQILVEQSAVSQTSVDLAADLQKKVRRRIGEILVESGLASPEQIDAALAEQKRRGERKLGQVLVELGILTETDLAVTLADKFHLPFVDLEETTIEPVSAVPRELIERFGILPLRSDTTTVTVAIADPLGGEAKEALRKELPRQRIQEVLATPTQLHAFVTAALQRADKPEPPSVRAEPHDLQKILEQATSDVGDADARSPASEIETRPDVADSAVIRLVNQIIIDAYRRGASDIHVEPNGGDRSTVVRFRVDGECFIYKEIPAKLRTSVVARMKIIAGLDIAERRKPQDGKIRFRFDDRTIELRVATIPTVNGNEDVVMRILAASKPMPLDTLALSPKNLAELTRLAARPYGLVLVVGPTGSGKTTTLHSVLGTINTPDTKIWTAEDPVEITQPGLRQVQVAPRVGLTFAAAMRAFLRADPDVIMVGEMRDAETAGAAVEASLTGHLVFSTLHTNSAPETVSRLIDMGVDPFTFADALLGVLAQRLARSLCPKCREAHEANAEEYDALARGLGEDVLSARGLRPHFQTFQSRGCDACAGAGYKGRVALHELLVVSDDLRKIIQRKGGIDEVRRAAADGGMATLLQDGLEKALTGKTDLKQVLSACAR
ncbi:MAG: ATPase, T2SS/T4P/T4SS family [Polyangiaceae bacterium]